MRKQSILYGIGLAILISLLKYFEYSYFIKSFSEEVYIGIIAVIFTGIGIWSGIKWVRRGKSKPIQIRTSKEIQKELSISDREMEVLIGITEGLTNKEIANRLFLSESTIKTHSSNLFSKMGVQRRTQAVQSAKTLGLLT